VQGRDGFFYGTTFSGGGNGMGTVFKMSAQGDLAVLYSFTGGSDGGNPWAGLVQGSDGYLYGTAQSGGSIIGGWGTVFKISTNGAFSSLYLFQGGNDGSNPEAGLVQGTDGYLYGTTENGGTNNEGGVFKLSTNGTLTGLYSFTGGSDGGHPLAGLVQGRDGDFYGTTELGSVFKISSDGAFTVLLAPGQGGIGWTIYGGLVQGADGYFYGTTSEDSFHDAGTVFRIGSDGAFTNLYSFGFQDGANPSAGLVQGSDGYLYGTTQFGGAYNFGTAFKLSTNGALTPLHSFSNSNDGDYPMAALVQGNDGSFYGTTTYGAYEAGTVFRLGVVPSAPVFQSLSLTTGALSLSWSTDAGARYQLQFISSLGSTNWSNLGDALIASGATLTATDSITNGPHRFYRVALLP
jgi:uncharacterized repeat protein (TIGR03803 family)